jgi:hypothetical protein
MSPRVEILGLPPMEAVRLRSAARAVAVLAGQASSARVAFRDENGPKGGRPSGAR